METTVDLSSRATSTESLRRPFTLDGAQLRSTPDGTGGEKLTFTGYACVTSRSYQMFDSAGEYPETVARGAFAGTLGQAPDVKFLLNHGGLPLARSSGGTLDLREDDTGLHVEARLNPDHPEVAYVRSAIERRDLNAMSFAFRILDEQGGWNEDFTARNITQVDLNGGDVALVNDPANPHTAGFASMRSVDAILATLSPEQAEELFRRLDARMKTAEPDPAQPDLQTYMARAYVLRQHT